MSRLTLYLFFLFSFFFTTQLFGQTSEEEFLYANLGYKEQLLKGLDDKKGYSWKPLSDYTYSDKKGMIGKKFQQSKFLFEGLYRDGESTPCALVAIYLENETMEKKNGTFICIPHPNSGQTVAGKARDYFDDEVKFNSDQLFHYSIALGRLSMYLAQGDF